MASPDREPGPPFGPALVAAVARAQARQAELYQATGLRVGLGKVLLILGDLADADLRELKDTALLTVRRGQKLLEAELLGEVALERGLVTATQLCRAVADQVEDRQSGRPHRLIGALLVERGSLRQRDLDACQAELPALIRLARARSRRLTVRERDGQGGQIGQSGLTSVDAAYIKAASAGRFDADQVLIAVERVKKLAPLLDEPLSLAEYLIVRGWVRADEHLDIVRENRDKLAEPNFMLGTVLVELGYAKPADVDQALKQRARESGAGRSRKLGEILVERGSLTAAELDEALRVQSFRRIGDPGERARRRALRRGVGAATALALVAALATATLAPRLGDRLARGRLADARVALDDRLAALARVAGQGTSEAYAAIDLVIDDPGAPAPLRAAAVRALGTAGRLRAERALALVRSGEPGLRAAAAWEAARAGASPALVAALGERLTGDAELAVRAAAARSLGDLGDARARTLLVEAVAEGSEPALALAAALALDPGEVRDGIAGALERLSGFALGADAARWRVWLELQPVADRARQPKGWRPAELPGLLGAADPGVAFVAARALAHQGDARGIHVLVRALDRDDATLQEGLRRRALDPRALEPELRTLLALLTGESLDRGTEGWLKWWAERQAAPAPPE